jgi:putative ABC transport system permease protein
VVIQLPQDASTPEVWDNKPNKAGDLRAFMTGLLQDARYARWQLCKNPGFTAVAVLTLAIGMGATTTIFSIVDTLLLRPLPYPNAPRVVRVWGTFAPRGMMEIPLSEPEFNEYRENKSFAHLAAFSTGTLTLTGTGAPLRVAASWVTSDFFSVFGTQPFLGRVFSADEYQPGKAQVAVVSYKLWMSRFDGNPGVVGKSILLNGQSCLVVGVMPQLFIFPSEETGVWQPLPVSPVSATLGNHYLGLVGDLKQGVPIEPATSEMSTILNRIRQKYPVYYGQAAGIGVRLVTLREQMVGNVRPIVLLLLVGVGFMLLIACTNVANLFLARGEKRKAEIAARTALGATRWRIARQVLLENLIVFLTGGILGTLLTFFSTNILSSQSKFKIDQAGRIAFDARVFAFAAGICLFTGLIFGLLPALRASRSDFNELLKAGGRNATGGHRARTRGLLVSSEIALSLVLLIGAGLMTSSLMHLLDVNLGFNSANVVTMRLSLPQADYSPRRTLDFYRELRDKVQAIPGVQAVAIENQLPMSDVRANASFEVEGRPHDTDIDVADTNLISPGYLQAMQIPLLHGRALNEEDAETTPDSIVVNQALARKIWPGADPIGKRIRLKSDAPWLTVVGVVADIKNHGVNAATYPAVYFPYTDQPIGLWTDFRTATLIVRTPLAAEQIVEPIRAQLHDLDPTLPIYKVATLKQIVSSSISGTRFPAFALLLFAAFALALAAIGVYGVLAYLVAQSRHEIGIRIALGATRGRILGSFLWQALKWAALGASVGLAATFILVRFMHSMLFQVSPFDPKVFLLVAAVLAAVALTAAILPARRAAKVEPMVALRYE